MSQSKPTVLIYSNNILSASETFIRNPALAFERYQAHFVGSLRVDGLHIPDALVTTAHGGGLVGRLRQQVRLRLTGDLGVGALAGRLRRMNPVLLQAHYGHAAAQALPLVQKLGLPFIVYFHGLDATVRDETFAKSRYNRPFIERRVALQESTTLFLTPSDYLRGVLLEKGYPANRVRTHYIGIETSGEAPLPLEDRDDIVLFVARLTKKKGATHLISAMARVQETHPNTKLVIVGDGPARERLEREAAETLRNYAFIGWQTPAQVDEWMRKARVFCVPSVTAPSGDAEGFGMVFIEAQRWGTPVASFAHGGIVESVADGETGLLAPERDTGALAANLIRLLEDDDLWRRFSQRGYDRVRQQFDLHQLAHRLEDLYDELLSTSQSTT